MTEPLVSEGGAYFDSLNARYQTGGAPGSGGSSSSGSVNDGANQGTANGGVTSTSTDAFDWGTTSYDPNGGVAVLYQENHYSGMACIGACHTDKFTVGGTVYQANGTSPQPNAQIGIRINGSLSTAYSGSQGNFFLTLSGTIDWQAAQVAVRTSAGSAVMLANAGLSGNCNGCHGSSSRIAAR